MRVIQSLWKEGKPLFAGDGYAGLSARWQHIVIGGLLKPLTRVVGDHCADDQQLQALENLPGYRRGEPGLHSRHDRLLPVRIPMYSASAQAKRVSSNPPDRRESLPDAARLLRLDILTKADPATRQGHLRLVLKMKAITVQPLFFARRGSCLGDHAFLLSVFEELLETCVAYSWKNEADAVKTASAPLRVLALLLSVLSPSPGCMRGSSARGLARCRSAGRHPAYSAIRD